MSNLSNNCAIEVGSNSAMEVWGCPTLLKNEISVHILLFLWHDIVFKHVQVTNASYSWFGEEERTIHFHRNYSPKKSRTCSMILCGFSVPHVLKL